MNMVALEDIPEAESCQVDIVTHDAISFISCMEAAWADGRHYPFAIDLAQQDVFAWGTYLACTEWGRKLLAVGVKSFWLAWLGWGYGHSVFYVRLVGGSELVIHPRISGAQAMERNETVVRDIQWHI